MCLNCGCGEPEKRHQPSDITADDVRKAADGNGMSYEKATANMRSAFEESKASGTGNGRRGTNREA
jgi:hypothetical protein